MRRNMLVCVLSADHGCREDRICWGEARRDRQRREEVESRDKRIYQCTGYEPTLRTTSENIVGARSVAHTHVMTGPSKKSKLFQCFFMYVLGSSTPMANTPMASTTRVTSSVIVLVTSRSPPPHPRGSKMLAPYGPD